MTDRSVDSSGAQSGTSSSLIQGAQANESAAWETLVDRYAGLVYRHCRRYGLQPSCAQDVMQEVFVAVSRKLVDFRHDGPDASFRGWLRTITERKIFDRARAVARVALAEGGSNAHDRWLQLAEQGSDSTLAPKTPTHEQVRLQQAMLQVREEVGERKWLLFCAVLLDGLSTEEAAAQFAVTPNVVYLAKSRTLRRLREVLNEGTSEEDEPCSK